MDKFGWIDFSLKTTCEACLLMIIESIMNFLWFMSFLELYWPQCSYFGKKKIAFLLGTGGGHSFNTSIFPVKAEIRELATIAIFPLTVATMEEKCSISLTGKLMVFP